MKTEIQKWWDDNAEDYQKYWGLPIDVFYGPEGSTEKELRLMGNVFEKNILEIGCGGAQNSIYLAKKGANLTGIDISKVQLNHAKNLAKDNDVKINFYQGDIIDLHKIKSESQDIVFSCWALHYVSDLSRCFGETYRVLKEKGNFIFSLDHPFWRRLDKKDLRIKKSYFETGRYEEKYKKGKFVAYDHTIEEITNSLIETGFNLEKILEPKFNNEKSLSYRDEAMKIIPRTIIYKSQKK